MTKTVFTAAVLALFSAQTVVAMPDQTSMLRTSLAHSLGSIGVDRNRVADLSLIELVTLRHILEDDTSEGQKGFRARAFLDRTVK